METWSVIECHVKWYGVWTVMECFAECHEFYFMDCFVVVECHEVLSILSVMEYHGVSCINVS